MPEKLTTVSDGSWPNWDEANRWLRGKFDSKRETKYAVPKADAGDGLKPASSGRVRPAAPGRRDARLAGLRHQNRHVLAALSTARCCCHAREVGRARAVHLSPLASPASTFPRR